MRATFESKINESKPLATIEFYVWRNVVMWKTAIWRTIYIAAKPRIESIKRGQN